MLLHGVTVQKAGFCVSCCHICCHVAGTCVPVDLWHGGVYNAGMEIDRGKLIDLLGSRKKYLRGHYDIVASGLSALGFIGSVLASGVMNSCAVTKIIIAATAAGYVSMFVFSLVNGTYSADRLLSEICPAGE